VSSNGLFHAICRTCRARKRPPAFFLEKECLLGSPRLARQGFRPLPPLTITDLQALLPPLPVPAVR
jgi:hypothetical protein